MVITNHVNVINRLRLMKCETQRLTVQYVNNNEEYHELKALDNSLTRSLTTQQKIACTNLDMI